MFVDPKDGRIKLLWMVILDVFMIFLLISPIVIHVVPLYPTAPIGILLLFVANFYFIWKAFRLTGVRPANQNRMPKLAWIGVAGSTIVCIVLIVSWIKKPDFQSTIQLFVGLLFAAYAWFLVRSLRRKQDDRLPR